MTPVIDPTGTVTSVPGFTAGAVYAGMKTYGEGKLDLTILASDRPCNVAATFTRNKLSAAAIALNREYLANGRAQAVIVNAGIANASTGERGIADARTATEWTAAKLGLKPEDVVICSTGVIGHFLPMDKMRAGIDAVQMGANGADFARAIMTTDTRPKHASVRFGPYTMGGCTKGAGMIHPNMATMLAFLTTDAPIEAGFLRAELSRVVDLSFNLLSIDGDTSPSDTVFLFSPDPVGDQPIWPGSPLAAEFSAALEALCIHLAKEMARDGEGATRVIEASVSGAASTAEAAQLVRLFTTSYLLKSAIHGADPNWGRIISVVGRSGVQLREAAVTVDLCGIRVFEGEQPTRLVIEHPEQVSEAMKGDTVTIAVHLGVGQGSATGWGCDLSAEYVHINADYHT